MDNALKPVSLEIGGHQRTLVYDWNAFAEFEELVGRPLGDLDPRTTGIRELRALLWVGLLHDSPDLTVHDVGRWVGALNQSDVMAKITEALQKAKPEEEAGVPFDQPEAVVTELEAAAEKLEGEDA